MPGVLAAAAIRINRIAGMQREGIGRAGAGDKNAERGSPVIAMRAANRIIMKWRHGGEISRRDRRLARPEREISRQLSPKSGFQGQVLSRHQHSRIGKTTSRPRDGILQWLEPRAARLR